AKYAIREIPKIKSDRQLLTKFTKELYIISSVSCLISYSLFIVAMIFIPKLRDYRLLLLICSTKIFFDTFGIEWFYNGLEKFKYISLRSLIFQTLSLFYLFIFVHNEKDYIHYAIFGLILGTMSNITNIVLLPKYLDFGYKCKLEIKKHFKHIFFFFGMTLVTSLYEILDTSMLGFLSTDAQVGIYTAGIKINRMSVEVLTAICAVFLPRLSKYYSENTVDKFGNLVEKGIKVIIILGLPLMTGIFLLSKPLIILFCGNSFLMAAAPMKIISPIIIFISISNLLSAQVLPAMNKEKISLITYVFAAVTNITLNYIFIPFYGACGAAVSTLIAEFIAFIIPCIILKRYVFIKEQFKNFMQALFSTIIMAIPVILILKFINNSCLQIVFSVILSILIYGLCLLILKNSILLEFLNKLTKKND
ncbi:MAG: polysaccharide biosynthesis C-terminal domain-containing protein, partial [Clostridia bacterium]|nr:polysaccharide biosynthesis C-terminal domain-containing protein [Clostridia bacterium]